MDVSTSTPPPTPEVYLIAGGIAIAIVIFVTHRVMKSKWRQPGPELPQDIEVSRPPPSTLFTIEKESRPTKAWPATAPRVYSEPSNLSEIFYSQPGQKMRQHTTLGFCRDGSTVTPVEEASSEGSRDATLLSIQTAGSQAEENRVATREGQDFTDTAVSPAVSPVSEHST